MSCAETQTLIHGYLDGEVDLVHALEIEQHLQDCAACTQVYRNQQALQAAIRGSALYFPAPPDLASRIQTAVRQAGPAPAPRSRVLPWRLLSFVAVAAVLVLALGGLLRSLTLPAAADPLAQEVVASHVRSLMAGHLADVASTDQHTVKPWFDGKIDFAPPVTDFAAQGFPLTGGRLDYLDNRPVAA
ncbi:MAG TPA: zf-HC2 domain-containing protein, partial [Chloroflexia bacterium]|nr:zf-HC2 domain-containing protein [Chloroflexia bacterium]